jgi:cellulose synthase/poly-beta-1,6-N-acetylglucosamine synthase-like glycosyltransferase
MGEVRQEGLYEPVMPGLIQFLKQKFVSHEANEVREHLNPPPLPDYALWPRLPLVSIIVAAWNEEAIIGKFLCSLEEIKYPNVELILVSGGDDKTVPFSQTKPNCQAIYIEQLAGDGKFESIKKGFAQASGEVVFLTDADCNLDSESFLRLIHPVVTGEENAVTGPTWPLREQLDTPFVSAQWVFVYRRMNLVPNQHVSFLIGANCALQSSLLSRCLSNSENQPIGEDYFLALTIQRTGGRILYDRAAGIETRYASTFRAYVRQKSRWYRSHFLLHFNFHDRRWIGDVCTSFANLFLLITPLLPFLLGLPGVLIWLVSWSIAFIPYLKARRLAGQLQLNPSVSLYALFSLMMADLIARTIALPQALFGAWQHRW